MTPAICALIIQSLLPQVIEFQLPKGQGLTISVTITGEEPPPPDPEPGEEATDCDSFMAAYLVALDTSDPFELTGAQHQLGHACLFGAPLPTVE